ALDRRHLHVSNLRLLVAGVGAVLVWLGVIHRTIDPRWSIGAGAVFAVLVIIHVRVLGRLDRARRAEAWYLRGLERLAGRWSGRGRGGARFLAGHPYARDLDLFGAGSVFELLNTAATEAGEETLAGWLRAGAPIVEVRARQHAVDELRTKVDFREALA